MNDFARKSGQLLLLGLFVAASAATSGSDEWNFNPLFTLYPAEGLPSIGYGHVEVPRNGKLFLAQGLATFLTLSTDPGGAVVSDEGSNEFDAGSDVLDAGRVMDGGVAESVEIASLQIDRTRWLAFDLSMLPVNQPVALKAHQLRGEDTLDTPFTLLRTEVDDVTPPTFTSPMVVEQYLHSEGAQEPDSALSDEPNRTFTDCTLYYTFNIEGLQDETHLAFVSLFEDDDGEARLVGKGQAWPGRSGLQISFSSAANDIPVGESCYWMEFSDLAGNSSRTEELCFSAERVEDC